MSVVRDRPPTGRRVGDVVNTAGSRVLWPTRAHEHSAAAAAEATSSSTRAALDSSSNHTPVAVLVLLLCTARAGLGRTSMSKFQAHWTAKMKTRDLDHSIAQAQGVRDKHKDGVAKQSRPHERSAAAVAAASSCSSSIQRHWSNTRFEDPGRCLSPRVAFRKKWDPIPRVACWVT